MADRGWCSALEKLLIPSWKLQRCNRLEGCKQTCPLQNFHFLRWLSHKKLSLSGVKKQRFGQQMYLIRCTTEQQSALASNAWWAGIDVHLSRLRCRAHRRGLDHHHLLWALQPWPPVPLLLTASVVISTFLMVVNPAALVMLEVLLTFAGPVHLAWLATHLHHLCLHHSWVGFV